MNDQDFVFELSQDIERYLAMLSKIYAREGQAQLEKIIVNAQTNVAGGYTFDNWNGGTYGHAVYLNVPESIYPANADQRIKIQNRIKKDLNDIYNVQNEFITEVFLSMIIPDEEDWRIKSGALISNLPVISTSTIDRIWGKDGYRVFLTHKSEAKVETAALKDKMSLYGISCFVAHEDIKPTREWQTEIENALFSMDALVALMTKGFHDSDWTDQEVGFAFGRGIPIISVRLGNDPYGFIGKFQALSCTWDKAPEEIAKILLKYEPMVTAYITAVRKCGSFNDGNTLSELLPDISRLTRKQVSDLISAYNENGQVRSSFGFNGSHPQTLGYGLLHHLNRLTGNSYKLNSNGKIEI